MFWFRNRFSVRAGKAYWRWFQENEQNIIDAIAEKGSKQKSQVWTSLGSLIATMLLYSPICRILRSNSSLAAMAV